MLKRFVGLLIFVITARPMAAATGIPPAQRDHLWSMDELVARLQGRYSARPHPMHVGQALRALGWTTRRDWTRDGGIGPHRHSENLVDVCFRGYSVAKLFSGCRIVIIESLYQMKRIILTEIGTATNQCYAKFPWTEFCNRIPPESGHPRQIR